MKDVILAGNATTAEILNAYLADDDRYRVIAATVDDEYIESGSLDGVESIAFSALAGSPHLEDAVFVMAMGYDDINRSRESMYTRLLALGANIETYIHPDAQIYTRHEVGRGSVILPGAVLEPHVRMGENSMVWTNTTLAHHCSVSDHCWVASGAVISGQAVVSQNCFVGVNATIVNAVTVGDHSVIGGGALITRDVEANTVHLARSAEQHRFPAQDYVQYFGV